MRGSACVSIVDMKMPLYTIIICITDVIHKNEFIFTSDLFLVSLPCITGKVLSLFSNLASTVLFTLLAINRMFSIVLTFIAFSLKNQQTALLLVIVYVIMFGFSIWSSLNIHTQDIPR